jgi:NAD(P)-dependent dehydrogenase (short-subunit alcohol dehydrogenase family)
MKGLQGKAAVVTGGSSGIGQAIAIRLARKAWTCSSTTPVPAGRRGDPGGHRARARQLYEEDEG